MSARALPALLALAPLLVAACGGEREQLYQGTGMVLDEPDRELVICFGDVALSYPPQCGGPRLTGWDWDTVEGEETTADTTWGSYHVVGTYDGETFSLVEVGPPRAGDASYGSDLDSTPRCPKSAGRFVPPDPARATEDDFDAGAAVAESRPDFVSLWVSYGDLTPREIALADAEGTPSLETMNVVVAEDPAGAEAAIREVWGGPLCVSQQEGHTAKELMAIREEAEHFIEDELGLEFMWSNDGDVGLAAEVGVIVDPGGEGQAALDERYGPGMVRLFPALRPVE